MNLPEVERDILSLRSGVLRKEVNQAEDLKFPQKRMGKRNNVALSK